MGVEVNTQESGRHKLGVLAFPPAHLHHKQHHAITAGAEVHSMMHTWALARNLRTPMTKLCWRRWGNWCGSCLKKGRSVTSRRCTKVILWSLAQA